MLNERTTKNYMRRLLQNGEHIDARTGEVNCTQLAEDALLEFNDEWSSDFDSEDAFEFAFQVAEEWEAHGVPA